MAKKGNNPQEITGSGDVFVDLGYADAGERRLKVQLGMKVNEILESRGLTQSETAKILGITQPHVSDLVNYKLNRFSSERLMRFLTYLQRDVEIIVREAKKSRKVGSVLVRKAA